MRALAAVCSRELARRRLVGWRDRWRTWRRAAPAARLELVYLPEWAALVCGVRRRRRRRGWLIGNSAAESLLALGGDEPPWDAVPPQQVLGAEAHSAPPTQLIKRQLRSSQFARGAWLLQPVAHPYWVYYVPRSGDRLDVRLLDAVTGRLVASRLKLAFLDALLHTARAARCERVPPPLSLHSIA